MLRRSRLVGSRAKLDCCYFGGYGGLCIGKGRNRTALTVAHALLAPSNIRFQGGSNGQLGPIREIEYRPTRNVKNGSSVFVHAGFFHGDTDLAICSYAPQAKEKIRMSFDAPTNGVPLAGGVGFLDTAVLDLWRAAVEATKCPVDDTSIPAGLRSTLNEPLTHTYAQKCHLRRDPKKEWVLLKDVGHPGMSGCGVLAPPLSSEPRLVGLYQARLFDSSAQHRLTKLLDVQRTAFGASSVTVGGVDIADNFPLPERRTTKPKNSSRNPRRSVSRKGPRRGAVPKRKVTLESLSEAVDKLSEAVDKGFAAVSREFALVHDKIAVVHAKMDYHYESLRSELHEHVRRKSRVQSAEEILRALRQKTQWMEIKPGDTVVVSAGRKLRKNGDLWGTVSAGKDLRCHAYDALLDLGDR